MQIAVTDTGPGVRVELRERVFEQFFRVEHHRPGTAEAVRGVGIGLSFYCHHAEAHRGPITLTGGDARRGTRIALEVLTETARRPVSRKRLPPAGPAC